MSQLTSSQQAQVGDLLTALVAIPSVNEGRERGDRDHPERRISDYLQDLLESMGMTVDPFAAKIRDGKVWGRGTCDTKGSMAAFITCRSHTGQSVPEGVHYYADSAPFATAGITSILFGPGDIVQAHTEAEFLDLDQLYLATQITLDWLITASIHSLVS